MMVAILIRMVHPIYSSCKTNLYEIVVKNLLKSSWQLLDCFGNIGFFFRHHRLHLSLELFNGFLKGSFLLRIFLGHFILFYTSDQTNSRTKTDSQDEIGLIHRTRSDSAAFLPVKKDDWFRFRSVKYLSSI